MIWVKDDPIFLPGLELGIHSCLSNNKVYCPSPGGIRLLSLLQKLAIEKKIFSSPTSHLNSPDRIQCSFKEKVCVWVKLPPPTVCQVSQNFCLWKQWLFLVMDVWLPFDLSSTISSKKLLFYRWSCFFWLSYWNQHLFKLFIAFKKPRIISMFYTKLKIDRKYNTIIHYTSVFSIFNISRVWYHNVLSKN